MKLCLWIDLIERIIMQWPRTITLSQCWSYCPWLKIRLHHSKQNFWVGSFLSYGHNSSSKIFSPQTTEGIEAKFGHSYLRWAPQALWEPLVQFKKGDWYFLQKLVIFRENCHRFSKKWINNLSFIKNSRNCFRIT